MSYSRNRVIYSALAAAFVFSSLIGSAQAGQKSWSKAEINQLIKDVKRGKAKCAQHPRTKAIMCDVN